MDLSAKVENATWEELNGSLLQELVGVLNSIYRKTVLSEAFSRALPYTLLNHVSLSITSSPKAVVPTSVFAPTNIAPSSTTIRSASIPTISALPSLSSDPITAATLPRINSPSRKSSKPHYSLTEAHSKKLERFDVIEHENIQKFLTKVEQQELDFWDPNIQQRITEEDAKLINLPNPYGVYLCLVLDNAEIHHKILQRFARVVVYHLSLQGYTAEIMAQAFQGSGLFKTDGNLQKQIEGYIHAGNRYTYLASQLGGFATLFFLPQSVGSSFWEYKTPKKGLLHDQIVSCLKKAGIVEVSTPWSELAMNLLKPNNEAGTPSEVRKRHQENSCQNMRRKVPRLSAVEQSLMSHDRSGQELCRGMMSKDALSEGQLQQRSAGAKTSAVSQATTITNPTDPDAQQPSQTASHRSKDLQRDTQGTGRPISPGSYGSRPLRRMSEVNSGQATTQSTMMMQDPGSSWNERLANCAVSQVILNHMYQGKAEVARIHDVERLIGRRLVEFMNTSVVRQLEIHKEVEVMLVTDQDHNPRITSAIHLYIVGASEEDFMLEISLGLFIGGFVMKNLAGTNSLKYLEALLGEHLFKCMMASKHRKQEVEREMFASTSAATVSWPSKQEKDCKLQIMIGYEEGRTLWYAAF